MSVTVGNVEMLGVKNDDSFEDGKPDTRTACDVSTLNISNIQHKNCDPKVSITRKAARILTSTQPYL